MKKNHLFNKMLSLSLVAAMTFSFMTGCKGKDNKDEEKDKSEVIYTVEEASTTKALKIGDYEIYLDELMVYAMQDIITYGVKSEDIKKDEKTNKDQALSLIRETKILYDVALHNDVELNDNDIVTKDQLVESFKDRVPDEVFEMYGVSDEVIDKVFTERTYVEKFQNDIQNQMGQDITNDLTEAYKDYNFQNIYYIMFPTIEVDKNDNPAVDDAGEYIPLSESEKAEVLKKANSAIEELRSGKDVEEVIAGYGVDKYSSEQAGYVGGYSDEVNEAVADLKAGECTDVMETELGYVTIYIIDDHNEELRDNYVYSIVKDMLQDQMESLKQDWLSTIPVDVENDVIGTAWDDFDMAKMSDILAGYGLVK